MHMHTRGVVIMISMSIGAGFWIAVPRTPFLSALPLFLGSKKLRYKGMHNVIFFMDYIRLCVLMGK